ncbi:hypothetical protein AB1Y20_016987 [Prymnesium parvum]|uniref:Cupin 2 conserved barrel domain-containing protein n=1 Tax=Prymnesium parvum TaxID=97485 RepID=A0AB34IA25_PRYPA
MEVPSLLVCLAGMIAAFAAGRWSTLAGPAPLRLKRLDDVAPEVAPSLSAPPEGHGDVRVPSLLRDVRGEVHNLKVGGFRFNVLVSRAGSIRSGDVHRSDQYDVIFSGLVSVTTRERGRDRVREYGAGQLLVIPRHVPHLFRFLNDTVMAEWWAGPFEARYYRPYRTHVDRSMQVLREAKRGGGEAAHRPMMGGRKVKAERRAKEGGKGA